MAVITWTSSYPGALLTGKGFWSDEISYRDRLDRTVVEEEEPMS